MACEITLKSLGRKHALLCLEVRRFIEKDICLNLKGKSVLAAFSGGADSTALLIILHVLATHMGFTLKAAHLDHALRPQSAREARMAGELCQRLGIALVRRRMDVAALARQWRCGVEEAARRARYEFFAAQGADWTATGHHAGDLAEDVLMRLTRGAVWPALGGMDAVDYGRQLLRPLLLQEKARLEGLLHHLGIVWAEDASNADTAYKRNRMRHQLLPLLLAENPSFFDAVRKLWRSAAMEKAWLEEQMPTAQQGELLLSRSWLTKLAPSLRLQAFAHGVRSQGGHPLHANLLKLEQAFIARSNGKLVQFPGTAALTLREGVRFTQSGSPGAVDTRAISL